MKKRLLFLVLNIIFFAGCSSSVIVKEEPGKQVEQYFDGSYEKEVSVNYLLYLPNEYDSKDKWPLLLFLHGAGERGNNLDLVKIHGPAKLIAQKKEFPFVVVSPQCPANARWKHETLIALLDALIAKYKIDVNRIYVTGLSMGGNGTWRLAAEIPDRIAAIIPICGWGDPFAVCMIGKLPVWTFHGAKDNVVPVGSTEAMVEKLKSCGGDVKFTVYPEAQHDSWTETYNNPEIYEWLLSHTLDQRIIKK